MTLTTQKTHSTAKWLKIRKYANSRGRELLSFQYYGKLRLIPLSIHGNIELIQEKFKNITTPNEQIINTIRTGQHRRIGVIPPGLVVNHKLNTSTRTMYFKALSHQEGPWLECTTIQTINAIQLEVQDEYGEMFKSSSTNDLPSNVTVAFADVPEEAI